MSMCFVHRNSRIQEVHLSPPRLREDMVEVVQQLSAKGIIFEHYDVPGMTRGGNVHVAGYMKVTWFKDPDGNILNITNR
jgi:hypothetical protein